MAKIQDHEFPDHLLYDIENQIWYEPLADGTLLTVWYENMKDLGKAVLRQAKWKIVK